MSDTENKNDKKIKPPGLFTRFRKEWLEPIAIALVLVVFIKTFLIQNYRIPSSLMEQILLIGDRFFAVQFLYGTRIPFTNKKILRFALKNPATSSFLSSPRDDSEPFIKDCIAVEGQTIVIRDKFVYVNGVKPELPQEAQFVDPRILYGRYGM